MKSNDLKKLIRMMVRECVHEMLAEKYIEQSMNEISGNRNKPSLQENVAAPVQAKKKRTPTVTREDLAKKYGFDQDGPMADIFQDTLNTNPVINGEDVDPPGTVSERIMEKSGIMAKDWSKYF